MRVILIVGLVLAVPSIGHAQAAGTIEHAGHVTSTVDPIGVYDFTTDVDGMPLTGTIHIEKAAEVLGGRIDSDMTGPMPITAVTIAEDGVSLSFQSPEGPGTFQLVIDEMELSGSWEVAGMSGQVAGRKRVAE